MAEKVANIAVRIGADASELYRELKKSETALQKLGRVGVQATQALATAALAAAAAVAALTAKGIALGDEMLTTSQRLGVAVNEIAALRHAARFANVEAGTLEAGMARLGIAVAKASEGSKEQASALAKLGLSATELAKLPLSEQMLAVGDAISQQTDATQKLATAQTLFGRGAGSQFVAVFKDGAAAVREQMAEARAYGLYLDGTQADVIARAADAQDGLKSAYEGLALQLGATFAPAIAAAGEALAGWSKQVVEALPAMQSLAEQLFGIAASAQNLSDAALQQTLLDNINALASVEDEIAARRRTMSADQLAMDGSHQARLQQQADIQTRINELLAERVKRANEAAAPTLDPVDENGPEGGFDLEAAQKAAAAELELVTAVYAEKERLAALEAEQNIEWATVLAEERDRLAQEEIDAERELVDAVIMERARLAEAEATMARNRVKTLIQGFTDATAAGAQHSKKMFDLNKKLALASAVINTHEAVTAALGDKTVPTLARFALAAVAAAKGFASVAAIKGTQYAGGGGGTTPSAAGTPVVNGNPVQQAAPSQLIRIEGSGDRFSRQQVRDLIEGINEAQRDGARLVFAG